MRGRRPRRAFVLLAVVVLVGSAMLVATGMLFNAQSEIAVVGTSADAAQSRAVAWSGVQIVMSELDRQRESILDGRAPRLDETYTVYETDRGRGVVRLLPVGPGRERLVAEAGKLDLNTIDAATLVATGFVDDALASAIVAHRDGAAGPLQSIDDLLYVDGVTVETLYGPLEEIDLPGLDDADPAPAIGRAVPPRGLADVLTVFAVEPSLQRDGRRRVALDAPWSESLRDRLVDRFGPLPGAALSGAIENGSLEDVAGVCAALRALEVPAEAWGAVTDAVTFAPDLHRYGRVDINSAPVEVLSAIDGIEPEQAATMVRARTGLSSDDRAVVTWPVVADVLAPEQFDAVADRFTTRCWTWRFRVAAGVVDDASAWRHPVVYEVVVDLSDPAPRVAYLRDVTLLATAARLGRLPEDAATPGRLAEAGGTPYRRIRRRPTPRPPRPGRARGWGGGSFRRRPRSPRRYHSDSRNARADVMLRTRDTIAIDLGRRLVRAVLASRNGRTVVVRKTLVAEVPADVDPTDPAAVGAWIGRQLRTAGFPKAPAVVALAREHVGLKRMSLPTTDPDELPRMTRLTLQRELPFEADDAVIDFVPTQRSATGTTVLAVAAPDDVIGFVRRAARAAGLTLERIGLRAMGAALLARGGEPGEGDTLIVDVTGEGIEFCIVRDGVIRFSRAAEMNGTTAAGPGETILTETRRTWMSYRIVDDSGGLARAVVLGNHDTLPSTAESIGEMLHVPAVVLEHHPSVEDGAHDLDRLWPLAGLLLESPTEDETIDFARPRRAPDRAGTRRRRLILAAGVLLVVLAGLWTFARRDLDDMDRQLAALNETRARLAPQYVHYFRDRYRLAHLEGWEAARVEWLSHAAYVSTMAPGPEEIVFDSWTGSLDFSGVEYDRRKKTWSSPRQITIVVDGDAHDRVAADAFRAALVGTDLYDTRSAGADAETGRRLPFGFTYRLETDADAPGVETRLGEATP